MLHFVLCDDNPLHNRTLHIHLTQLMKSLPVACVIDMVTTDPKEVMRYAASAHEQTVYFLDLVFEQEINGLDVCQAILQADSLAYIIYVSAYAEYAMDCCRSHAFDFILKPYTVQRLESAMRDVMRHVMRAKPAVPLWVTAGTITHVLDQREIRYLQSRREYVTAYTAKEQITWRESMAHVLPRLSEGWFDRIHKSYAVNRHFIRKIDVRTHEITLAGDIVLPVSRSVCKRYAVQRDAQHKKMGGG